MIDQRRTPPTSESLQPIQFARAEYDLRAAFSQHHRSRFADSAARASDNDDLVFDIRRKVLLYTFYLPLSHFSGNRLFLRITAAIRHTYR
jgi:hypothetical protein